MSLAAQVIHRIAERFFVDIYNWWEQSHGHWIGAVNKIKQIPGVESFADAKAIFDEAVEYSTTQRGQFLFNVYYQGDHSAVPYDPNLRNPFGDDRSIVCHVVAFLGDASISEWHWFNDVPGSAELHATARDMLTRAAGQSPTLAALIEEFGLDQAVGEVITCARIA